MSINNHNWNEPKFSIKQLTIALIISVIVATMLTILDYLL